MIRDSVRTGRFAPRRWQLAAATALPVDRVGPLLGVQAVVVPVLQV